MSVFLCHHTRDKPLVKQIATRLEAKGYRVWLDEWHLIPGNPRQESLEKGLEKATCVVVFLGPELGSWQNEELRIALDRRVDGENRAVPVLLPGTVKRQDREIPSLLRNLIWVTIDDIEDEGFIYRLGCGIEGKEPGKGQKSPAGKAVGGGEAPTACSSWPPTRISASLVIERLSTCAMCSPGMPWQAPRSTFLTRKNSIW